MPTEYMHLLFMRFHFWRVTVGEHEVEVPASDVLINTDAYGTHVDDSSLKHHTWRAMSNEQRAQFEHQWTYFLDRYRDNVAELNARELRGWACYAYPPSGGVERVDVEIKGWFGGAPLEAVTQVLNRLAADGWAVVATGEDKGLYAGADARNESYPARLRYLLERRVAGPSAVEPASA